MLDGDRSGITDSALVRLSLFGVGCGLLRFKFGDSLGDSVAERIWDALKLQPEGMSRTEIVDLFCRKKNRRRLDVAIDLLLDRGLIVREKVYQQVGRPKTVHYPLYVDPTLVALQRVGSKGQAEPLLAPPESKGDREEPGTGQEVVA